jgi:protein-disulfide isomerase
MQTPGDTTSRRSARLFWIGLACLLLAVASSLVLAGKHLQVLEAPGCGDGSPCDQAAASVWGSVPLVGWPTSFAGLAWFTALVPAWIALRRRAAVPRALRNLVRLGAAASAGFMVVMVVGGYICPYCIAVHVGNFGFLAVLEATPAATAGTPRALGWAAAAFVAVTAVELGLQAAVTEEIEQQLSESTQRIIDTAQDPNREPFTGRYRLGPADAPIRLVIFTDYQCPDCRLIERQVQEILSRRDDVSFSVKHNPICTACNPHTTRNMHPNACWAARAAETAGILRGNDGFWQMHEWLFERRGGFTDAEIVTGLRELGYDPRPFLRTMQGAETLRLVQADLEEAWELGIHQTPMIFINGVELKGWLAPQAVIRAVESLAATNPPPGTARQDQPPSAAEKFVAEWREKAPQALAPDTHPWTMGPQDARVSVVIWGDYRDSYTSQADAIIRRLTASRGDVRYAFRHYPMDESCNPATTKTQHPHACYAARAAEAAGAILGADGYWAMHAWLLEDRDRLSEQALRAFAVELAIDEGARFAEMEAPELDHLIAEDAEAAKAAGLRNVPCIFINGKMVPRWTREGVLEAIVEDAARSQSPTRR